ncbi:hypothetical protein WEN_00530 [Mycoplasma wenyonii str. Massachusetts]|uniref:Uncharacterized protein n=1 Tax=Mycoplasma wenyonii (strain Massachusetts) TaxID=1197325 RepID=I6Z5S3_MYCWM|nr:hypothetical protein [Mycoplasma wenyonii]AFN64913.1 hypothetical protein WEN_00530 [Mycoplasma wenyonii str. Massachusetts]
MNSVGAQASTSAACQLKYLSSSEAKNAEISYLLETATKFLETQHAINMLGFYTVEVKSEESELNSGGGGGDPVNELSKECSFSEQETKEFSRNLFFKPKTSSQNCYLSPSGAKIHIVIENGDGNNGVTKDKLSKGSMRGEITYGIFDYHYSLRKKTANLSKGAGLQVKWPLVFKLEGEVTDECNWGAFNKLAKARELRRETLSKCV